MTSRCFHLDQYQIFTKEQLQRFMSTPNAKMMFPYNNFVDQTRACDSEQQS